MSGQDVPDPIRLRLDIADGALADRLAVLVAGVPGLQLVGPGEAADAALVLPAAEAALRDGEIPLSPRELEALDRVKAMAPKHPEWKTQEPYKTLLAGDVKGALAQGEKAMLGILAATHSGMTTEEFASSVEAWAASAKHPKSGRLYTEMVYQPMLELLRYLRGKGSPGRRPTPASAPRCTVRSPAATTPPWSPTPTPPRTCRRTAHRPRTW